MLAPMAELASAIVTTGPALSAAVRDGLAPAAPLHEVPDGAETPADVRAGRRRLHAARARVGPRAVAAAALRSGRRTLASTRANARRARPGRRPSDLPRVVWFGNVGSVQPRFGLVNLVDIAGELAAAAHERPFRLLVVSGSEAAYRRDIAPLPLPTEYRPWSAGRIRRDLRGSAVAIVPNSRDPFSVCKSANRVVLALSAGTPVVATDVPALAPLRDSIALDDFAGGLARYLGDPGRAASDVARGRATIQREYAGAAVAARWRNVLAAIGAGRVVD
jgi:glycosyltransferase involved in cell wall biosynthesis